MTILLKKSLNLSDITLSSSMMTLFSIKEIFWEQVTFSENSGLTFFQNFLLSQTIEGFIFPDFLAFLSRETHLFLCFLYVEKLKSLFSLPNLFRSFDLSICSFLSSFVMKGFSFALIYFCLIRACALKISQSQIEIIQDRYGI